MPWFRRRGDRPAPSPSTSAQLRSALHLVLAGDLAGAESALAEAARVDSSSADVYLALANLYRARGEIGRAIQIHQNLMLWKDIGPATRREALLSLALDFRAGGFLKRAAASFQELLEFDPQNPTALRELERIHVESGEWEKAIQIRRRIGATDPRTRAILAHLWTGLGRDRAKAGRETDARKAFRRALGHDRSCAEAYLTLGDERFRDGKSRKAIGLWQRALPLHRAVGILLYPKWMVLRPTEVAYFQRQRPLWLETHYQLVRTFDVSARLEQAAPGRSGILYDSIFHVLRRRPGER